MENIDKIKNVRNQAVGLLSEEKSDENDSSVCDSTPRINTNHDNVIPKEAIKQVYINTLDSISSYLENTFGPMGSYTKIITGNDNKSIVSDYSKDGHKVLKHIMFTKPIEMSIRAELEDITHHVEMEVGDGTTSAVLLSSLIYKELVQIMDNFKVPPYLILDKFHKEIEAIQKIIRSNGREVTKEDIYNICMISTNSNKEVSKNIADIYDKFGLDVSIDVSISNTSDFMIKEYDGLTLTEGYSDPAYINNTEKGTCEIYNPHIYAFKDPVDTPDMIMLFEAIINNNIIEPIKCSEPCIPTVIICPKMSRDMGSIMEIVIETMNQCVAVNKPPLLVLTDIIGSDEATYLDIAKLCGCTYIKKYIDPDIEKMDREKGLAPTLDNVSDFYGSAELVVADISKTKFVNPSKMYEINEDGERVKSKEYRGLLTFLQSDLDHARANNEDDRSIASKRKRLNSLKSNMVEYLIGGITIGDRNSTRDLVIDAVKNCRSACINGVGYAANFEGLRASYERFGSYISKELPVEGGSVDLDVFISSSIFSSYVDISTKLYSTIKSDKSEIDNMINTSLAKHHPYNLKYATDSFNEGTMVLTSIDTDIKILEAISKIISLMVSSNQCLVQSPNLNTYTV